MQHIHHNTRSSSAVRWASHAALLVALAMLTLGCRENEFVPPPPPDVTVATPIVRDVTRYAEFSGRTEPMNEVEVRARVEGILLEILAQPGQHVEKDQLLFRIDPDLFVARRDAAAASVQKAEAELEVAQVRLDRTERAAEQGAANPLEVLEARARVNTSKADLAVAQRELAIRQLSVDDTEVRAPLAGEMMATSRDIGSLVGTFDTALLTRIYDSTSVYAWLNVSDRAFLENIARGGRASDPQQYPIHLATEIDTGFPHAGVIDYIDPVVDVNTGTIRIRALFPNPDGVLRGGLFVRCQIVAGTIDSAILIPEAAISTGQIGTFVMIVGPDNIVQVRPVTLGPTEGSMRVIASGLTGDERVIVRGLLRARPGQPVSPKIQPETAPAKGAE